MELQRNKTTMAKRALKEHFEVDVDLSAMDIRKTRQMLTKVRGLLKESRQGAKAHAAQTNSSYLKLVMMEQMLSNHYSDIRIQSKIVVENEEVEKSQVILAAQDMIDSVQKMIEQISKMNAEELPAVVDGISNEIGTSESETFQQSVGEALTSLLSSLTEVKGNLTSALGQVTGQEAPAEPSFGGDEGDMGGMDDMGGDEDSELPDFGGDEDAGNEEPVPELPEPEEDLGGAGRGMR